MPGDVRPSESGLIYCFADRCLSADPRGRGAPRFRPAEAMVSTQELAEVIWAAALASLLRRGRASLRLVEARAMAEPTLAAWRDFQAWLASEPLAGAVRTEVAKAIESRLEKDED